MNGLLIALGSIITAAGLFWDDLTGNKKDLTIPKKDETIAPELPANPMPESPPNTEESQL